MAVITPSQAVAVAAVMLAVQERRQLAGSNVLLLSPPGHPHTSANGESVAVVCPRCLSLSSWSLNESALAGRSVDDVCTSVTLTRPSGATAGERLELAGCEPLSCSHGHVPSQLHRGAEHLCCIQHTETPPCFTSLAYCLQHCLTRFLEALSLHFHLTPFPRDLNNGLEACRCPVSLCSAGLRARARCRAW